MKKKIFINLFNDITVFFVISSFTLTLIVWILQAVNFLDIVSEDGHSLATYFLYSLLNIPKIFSKLMILTYFLSIFYILSVYENKNQILIFWMNGISKSNFMNKLFYLSIIFVVFSFLLSFLIVPYTQNKARSYIRNSNLDFFPSLIKPKKFIDTVENLTIFIDEKKNNSLKKVLIKDISGSYSQLIIANTGIINNDVNQKFLKLDKGVIINYGKNKSLTSFNFEESVIDLNKYKTKTTTTPKIQEISSIVIIKCLILLNKDLNTNLNFENLNCKKNFQKDLISEIYKRIYIPIYLPLAGLFATFLILKNNSSANFKYYRLKVFLSGVLIIMFSQISINLISKNIIIGSATIIFPILIMIIAYIIFLNRMKTTS